MQRHASAGVAVTWALALALVWPSGEVTAMPFGLVDDGELECLALNVYFEARSEPSEGQLAVAYTTLNRVADRKFPNSVCEVVRQGGDAKLYRCQFSWWCDGKSDKVREMRAWQRSVWIAEHALRDHSKDPTGGALFYHSTDVRPSWSRHFKLLARIGKHLFYR